LPPCESATLEEARADLLALWNAWDRKLKEFGLVSNQDEVAKAMYDSAAMVASCRRRSVDGAASQFEE